jgi:hypothetical protein
MSKTLRHYKELTVLNYEKRKPQIKTVKNECRNYKHFFDIRLRLSDKIERSIVSKLIIQYSPVIEYLAL